MSGLTSLPLAQSVESTVMFLHPICQTPLSQDMAPGGLGASAFVSYASPKHPVQRDALFFFLPTS